VAAIGEVGRTSEEMRGIAVGVALEARNAAIHEIVRGVASAATGTRGVSANGVDLRRGADEAGAASAQVLAAARGLAHGSEESDQAVKAFLARRSWRR
jgi:methyl-accepting chemotaxis protein